jgi:K+-transporting ATPase ATPase C chain
MNNFKLIRPALSLFVVLSAITGLAYPLLVTSVAQTTMPEQANGSLIMQNDKVLGSALIGQSFSQPYYLWGRPSATAEHAYNGMASGGSNLGPLNPELAKQIKQRIEALHQADPTNQSQIPIDLITTSASGLDPDISPAAAVYQVNRIAKARGISAEQVQQVIDQHTTGDKTGLIGTRHVNVLAVNLSLDKQYPLALQAT